MPRFDTGCTAYRASAPGAGRGDARRKDDTGRITIMKHFVLQNPDIFTSQGMAYCERYSQDVALIEYAASLDMVREATVYGTGKTLRLSIWLSPLFDFEEGWLLLYEALDKFSAEQTKWNDVWEHALDDDD